MTSVDCVTLNRIRTVPKKWNCDGWDQVRTGRRRTMYVSGMRYVGRRMSFGSVGSRGGSLDSCTKQLERPPLNINQSNLLLIWKPLSQTHTCRCLHETYS